MSPPNAPMHFSGFGGQGRPCSPNTLVGKKAGSDALMRISRFSTFCVISATAAVLSLISRTKRLCLFNA